MLFLLFPPKILISSSSSSALHIFFIFISTCHKFFLFSLKIVLVFLFSFFFFSFSLNLQFYFFVMQNVLLSLIYPFGFRSSFFASSLLPIFVDVVTILVVGNRVVGVEWRGNDSVTVAMAELLPMPNLIRNMYALVADNWKWNLIEEIYLRFNTGLWKGFTFIIFFSSIWH